MNAVKTSTKRKNDHIFTRSASVPETIEAAVATKTIWKNQPAIDEYPCLPMASVKPPSPAASATSSDVGP